MDYSENYAIDYWKKKTADVIKISNDYGYDFNREFWERQPAGVISLIIDIQQNKKEEKSWLMKHRKKND